MTDPAEALEAERYTHSRETIAQVRRRVEKERPESPFQAQMRRRHEVTAAWFYGKGSK